MKKLVAALLLGTALATPSFAMAREVTLTTQMSNYYGNNAYIAIYLTQPNGQYDSTIWLAGRKQRFLGELRGWVTALQTAKSLNIDGITGASVGSGQTLTLHANLADSIIDAGYQIHVETAVQDAGEYPNDVVVPLSSAPQTAQGSGYVGTFSVKM
jgi:hypothetical protein